MDVETIRELHEYNIWANERVMSCAAQVSSDDFTSGDDTPWGSIRNQLVHLLDVHRRWLNWVDGTMSGEEAYALSVEMSDFPDLDSICAWWEELREQTKRFLGRMTQEDLDRELDAGVFSVPAGKVMIQIALHSMQHRSETAMVLTRLGQSPGDIDYIFYSIS